MTRKHFANLAQSLGDSARDEGLTLDQTQKIAYGLMPALRAANPGFKGTRFLDAVTAAYNGEHVPYATV